MELSPKEEKFISQIKKMRKMNKWFRWVKVILALLMFGIAIMYLNLGLTSMNEFVINKNDSGIIGFAISYPLAITFIGLSIFIATHTFIHWNGDQTKELLIKLAEDNIKNNG